MNLGLGGIVMMMFVLICAVVGIYVIADNTSSTPYVDTAGNTTSNSTNTSQQIAGNVTGVAPTIGTGVVVILAVIFIVASAGVLIAAGTASSRSYRSRY